MGFLSGGGPAHSSLGYTGLCSRALYTWARLAGGLLISQQVIFVWCSRSLYIWGQLAGEGLLILQ